MTRRAAANNTFVIGGVSYPSQLGNLFWYRCFTSKSLKIVNSKSLKKGAKLLNHISSNN